ncbi:hypothetical protein [Microbulbifer sp. VAAF005]|uniref:hypothetical protein n=1 Tax=Microbulbifer sp. VAAF005 TaxID=3034230 RepID=UPI0024AE21AE|nr:hypothetical protein [Microbulbifer sp. VAAF005]WHI45963.1 hypothetical protein P0078_19925 [Microbulbifer sp. VAAF005]
MPSILKNMEIEELCNVWNTRIKAYTLLCKTNNGKYKKRKSILDPESDDAVEISNDFALYSIILEKISDNPDV